MLKNYCFTLLLFLFLLGVYCTQAQQVVRVLQDTVEELTDSLLKVPEQRVLTNTKVDSLIQYAYSFIGNRYKYGGTTTKGFDCSGYTMTVFKQFNIKLPHTSAGQGLMGVTVLRNNLSKGDLVFFRGRNRRSNRIGHVGIVISDKGEPVRFIHSSTSEGVRIDRLEFLYYQKRFVKAVRIPELHR